MRDLVIFVVVEDGKQDKKTEDNKGNDGQKPDQEIRISDRCFKVVDASGEIKLHQRLSSMALIWRLLPVLILIRFGMDGWRGHAMRRVNGAACI